MPPSPLRIAILECDSAPARAHIKHGGYGGLFTRLLNAGAAALAEERSDAEEVRLKISVFDVENEMERYPALEDVDAVLITGSSESLLFPFFISVSLSFCFCLEACELDASLG